MSSASDRSASVDSSSSRFPWARRIATHNPLYAISAALVFYGLRISFGVTEHAHAAGLMTCLAAYVVLLASTAVWLRSLGALWEDVRMLALLVLLLLLGISSTFDAALLADFRSGVSYYLIGWAFAAIVCEGLFHGLRVRLPVLYRAPFHALLALFFLYPLGAAQFATDPANATLQWLLFGFPCAAALVLSSLVPAVARGPQYVADNGTPWGWPLYPATLFAFLTLGVVGRAYYLCISLHAIGDDESIFGTYFLAPPTFAVAALVLVAAGHSRSKWTSRVALALPLVGLLLSTVRTDGDVWYSIFLSRFYDMTGMQPVAAALVATVWFYALALTLRTPRSFGCLVAAILAISVVHGRSFSIWDWQEPWVWPIVTVTVMKLAWGLWRSDLASCLVAAGSATLAAAVITRSHPEVPAFFAIFHTALASLAMVGALFPGPRGSPVRGAAALLLLASVADSLFARPLGLCPELPIIATYYAPVAMVTATAYGICLQDRFVLTTAALIAIEWCGVRGFAAYLRWRKFIPGLDAIALGLLSFAAAVVVSLLKAGQLDRWFAKARPVEPEEDFV